MEWSYAWVYGHSIPEVRLSPQRVSIIGTQDEFRARGRLRWYSFWPVADASFLHENEPPFVSWLFRSFDQSGRSCVLLRDLPFLHIWCKENYSLWLSFAAMTIGYLITRSRPISKKSMQLKRIMYSAPLVLTWFPPVDVTSFLSSSILFE